MMGHFCRSKERCLQRVRHEGEDQALLQLNIELLRERPRQIVQINAD